MATTTKKAPDLKKEVSEAASKIVEAGKKTASEVQVEAKKAATTATKKATTAKKSATAAAKKATTTAKKAATTAAKKAKKELVVTSYVEFAGNQYDVDAILDNVKNDFKAKNKSKTLEDLKLYIKPEENAAYYVANSDYPGRVDLQFLV